MLNRFKPVGQTYDYSCGAACVTSVLNTKGIRATELDVLGIMEPEAKRRGLDPSEGFPPDILMYALDQLAVSYDVYASHGRSRTGKTALKILKKYLDSRYLCIVDIQATPEYLYIAPNGDHVADSDLPKDFIALGYIPLLVSRTAWLAGLPVPSGNAQLNTRHFSTTNTWVENGHYLVAVAHSTHGVRSGILTMDPGYYEYQEKRLAEGSTFPAEMLGFRWHEENYFVKRWYDSDKVHRITRHMLIAVPT